MTITGKSFDCIEMKTRIQGELLAEKKRLGEMEVARRRREWLETSPDHLAAWWRGFPCEKRTGGDLNDMGRPLGSG
jgi:hypothetical protein